MLFILCNSPTGLVKDVLRLKAIPGISAMGVIILLSRIGDIKRFKNPDSLANYFGLTPGCHNTAGKHRVGGITMRGNAVARHVLNFAVNHIVRKCPSPNINSITNLGKEKR